MYFSRQRSLSGICDKAHIPTSLRISNGQVETGHQHGRRFDAEVPEKEQKTRWPRRVRGRRRERSDNRRVPFGRRPRPFELSLVVLETATLGGCSWNSVQVLVTELKANTYNFVLSWFNGDFGFPPAMHEARILYHEFFALAVVPDNGKSNPPRCCKGCCVPLFLFVCLLESPRMTTYYLPTITLSYRSLFFTRKDTLGASTFLFFPFFFFF